MDPSPHSNRDYSPQISRNFERNNNNQVIVPTPQQHAQRKFFMKEYVEANRFGESLSRVEPKEVYQNMRRDQHHQLQRPHQPPSPQSQTRLIRAKSQLDSQSNRSSQLLERASVHEANSSNNNNNNHHHQHHQNLNNYSPQPTHYNFNNTNVILGFSESSNLSPLKQGIRTFRQQGEENHSRSTMNITQLANNNAFDSGFLINARNMKTYVKDYVKTESNILNIGEEATPKFPVKPKGKRTFFQTPENEPNAQLGRWYIQKREGGIRAFPQKNSQSPMRTFRKSTSPQRKTDIFLREPSTSPIQGSCNNKSKRGFENPSQSPIKQVFNHELNLDYVNPQFIVSSRISKKLIETFPKSNLTSQSNAFAAINLNRAPSAIAAETTPEKQNRRSPFKRSDRNHSNNMAYSLRWEEPSLNTSTHEQQQQQQQERNSDAMSSTSSNQLKTNKDRDNVSTNRQMKENKSAVSTSSKPKQSDKKSVANQGFSVKSGSHNNFATMKQASKMGEIHGVKKIYDFESYKNKFR